MKFKTIRDLTSYIAKKEGKKSNVLIGDVKEVGSIISDLVYYDSDVREILVDNGRRRAKRSLK
jgi:hypothetical protein